MEMSKEEKDMPKNIQNPNIGIDEEARKRLADGLHTFLADSYTLYLKTQNFHWNVSGPMFAQLHLLFETQYKDLASAADLIAERVRALGFFVPSTFKEFTRRSTISEPEGIPSTQDMLSQLIEGNEISARTARGLFPMAEKVGDQATCNLLADRMQQHEKNSWMLRSQLS